MIATIIPKPTRHSENNIPIKNSFVTKSSKNLIHTSTGDGKNRGRPIIKDAISHIPNQNIDIKNILNIFLKLSAIVKIITGNSVTDTCGSNGIHSVNKGFHSILHIFSIQICNIAFWNSVLCNFIVSKNTEFFNV